MSDYAAVYIAGIILAPIKEKRLESRKNLISILAFDTAYFFFYRSQTTSKQY